MNSITPIACNLNAIDAETRPRYQALVTKLKSAILDRGETPLGYRYRLASGLELAEVAEWISLERLCCPFLDFRLEISGTAREWYLTLEGPTGVKEILNHAFPT